MDVGWTCAYLATPFARRLTGDTVYHRQWRQHRGLMDRTTMSSIAVINAGSSSLKFAVFDAKAEPSLRLKGLIEGIGATPRAKLTNATGETILTGGA